MLGWQKKNINKQKNFITLAVLFLKKIIKQLKHLIAHLIAN